MIAFVTSLRHPDNSASYSTVESLLQQTLASVTAQTVNDFIVIVVGNRHPAFPLPDRVRFVEVDFPAPAPPTGPHTPRTPFVWDKGTKIGIGLAAAREFRPDHVMIFDADDFVSRRLVEFVGRGSSDQGWVVSHGLMYSNRRNACRDIRDFNRTCGTSFIIPFGVYAVPHSLSVTAPQEIVAAAYGERLWRILGAHRDAEKWFAENGTPVKPLPFPGAVYHVDTGENHSGKSMTGVARPLRVRTAKEFGIHPSRSRLATIWSASGPVAWWETTIEQLRRIRWRLRLG